MGQTGTIRAICTSPARGTPKTQVQSAVLELGWGIVGDAHGGDWHRQVSLLSGGEVDEFNARGAQVQSGAFGENLVVDGIDLSALPVGAVLSCGEARLQVTQIGKECHTRCAIYDRVGDCIMPRAGVFAKVLCGGAIGVGDEIAILPHFRAAVLTLSDKGAAGQRADLSGACAAQLLTAAGYEIAARILLPDERAQIEQALVRCADEQDIALVVTTGGTGLSPRDVTPEATLAVADRVAPGIAEAIRLHSMQITKRAMLGRGVAVIRKKTLIVNLPGSPKAVGESLSYILPELVHGLEILREKKGDCAQ